MAATAAGDWRHMARCRSVRPGARAHTSAAPSDPPHAATLQHNDTVTIRYKNIIKNLHAGTLEGIT